MMSKSIALTIALAGIYVGVPAHADTTWQTPTWTNLAWESNSVNAGDEAVLDMDLNGIGN